MRTMLGRCALPLAALATLAAGTFACPRPRSDEAHPDPIAPEHAVPSDATTSPSTVAAPPTPSASEFPFPPSCTEHQVLFTLEDADADEILRVLESMFDRKRAVHADARARVACTLATIRNTGCIDIDEAFRQCAEALRAKGLVLTKTAKTLEVAKAPGPGCAP